MENSNSTSFSVREPLYLFDEAHKVKIDTVIFRPIKENYAKVITSKWVC